MSWPARFDGDCAADCGERIHPGDEITRDESGTYRHAECVTIAPTDRLTIKPTEVVCPDCWLVKPCRCDD